MTTSSNKIIELINGLKYGKSISSFKLKTNKHETNLFSNTYKLDDSVSIEYFCFDFYNNSQLSVLNIFMNQNEMWITINKKNKETGSVFPHKNIISITKGKNQIKQSLYEKIQKELIKTRNRNYKQISVDKTVVLDYSQMSNL
jgi:hypothetical protein